MKFFKGCFFACTIAMGVCLGRIYAVVIAMHEHDLKPGVLLQNYETEVASALQKMQVRGLLHAYHLKGFKGERADRYAVLWVFESRRAIEDNFGTKENPKWPADWLFYENEVLGHYLTCHPDAIHFTDYAVIAESNYDSYTTEQAIQ